LSGFPSAIPPLSAAALLFAGTGGLQQREKAIADVTFADPKIDLFSNVTGEKVVKGSDAKKNAVLHLTNPVRWTLEEKVLADVMDADSANEWCVLEPGVGKVLSGLWRDSPFGEKRPSTPVNSAESIGGVE